MLKLLLKKQFISFFSTLTKSKKKNKNRSILGICLVLILVAIVLASVVYFIVNICELLKYTLIPVRLNWIYFSIMGLVSVILDVILSVFSTYSTIYVSKDNEMLLSLPIKPKFILISRLLGCYLLNLGVTLITYLPATIYYFIKVDHSALTILLSSVNVIFLPVVSLSLCLILGYIVALIAPHVKRKNGLASIMYLVVAFLVGFLYSFIPKILEKLLLNPLLLGKNIKHYFYPFYKMGQGCTGKILPYFTCFTIFTGIFTLLVFFLTKNYLKLITLKKGFKKAKYKGVFNYRSQTKALFCIEASRFFGTPIYWINCMSGSLGLVALTCIVLFVPDFGKMFNLLYPNTHEIKTLIALIPVLFLLSTNLVTASSINMEGKNLWIKQSLPLKVTEIFKSKVRIHVLISLPVAIIATIVLNIKLNASWYMIILSLTTVTTFVFLTGILGIVINLLIPKLDWTSVTQAVKQSFSLFVEMIILFALIGSSIFICVKFVRIYWLFLLIITILIQIANIILLIYLKKIGTKKYTYLHKLYGNTF